MISKTKSLMLLLAAFFAFTASAQDGIKFYNGTFQAALKEAETQNKLLFVDFYASWCGPCKKMAAVTFQDKEVGEFFNQNFVAVKIDCEANENIPIAKKYKIMGLPTTMFMTPDGKVVATKIGYMKPDQILHFAKGAQEDCKK